MLKIEISRRDAQVKNIRDEKSELENEKKDVETAVGLTACPRALLGYCDTCTDCCHYFSCM